MTELAHSSGGDRDTSRTRSSTTGKQAARELAGLLGLGLLNWLYLNVGPLIAGAWSDEAGLDTRQVGFLMTVQLVASAATSIGLSGRLDRMAPRRWGLAAGVILVAANAWFAWRSDFVSLAIGCVIAGVALGCLNALWAATLAATGNPTRMAAISYAAGTIVVALATVPIAHLTRSWGMRGLFGAQTIVAVVALGLTAAVAPDRSSAAPREAMPLFRAVHFPFVASAVFIELATAGVWAFTERVGARVGLGQDVVGDIIAAASLCGIGGGVAAMVLERWRRDATLALLTTAAFGVAASAIPIAASPPMFAAALGAQAFFFVFAGPFVTAIGVTRDRSGGLVAAAHGWGLLAGGIAPVLSGWIIEPDRFGRLTAMGLLATALAIGALALAIRGNFDEPVQYGSEP
jgi:predicted MFS family arabinose efflux permease